MKEKRKKKGGEFGVFIARMIDHTWFGRWWCRAVLKDDKAESKFLVKISVRGMLAL